MGRLHHQEIEQGGEDYPTNEQQPEGDVVADEQQTVGHISREIAGELHDGDSGKGEGNDILQEHQQRIGRQPTYEEEPDEEPYQVDGHVGFHHHTDAVGVEQ